MIKHLHLLFVVVALTSFVARVFLAEFKPAVLQNKLLKIVPHIIDSILLFSGLALVFQGNWLEGEFSWIISKIMLLFAYIGLGVMAMRCTGIKRWGAFIGALSAFAAILCIAITKYNLI